MKNKKIKIIILSFIVVILLGLLLLIPHKTIAPSNTQTISVNQNIASLDTAPTINQTPGIKTTLQINDVSYEDNIAEKTSVYDFMSQLRAEGKINFTEKNYIGIGEFIESINGIKNSDSLVWIYYINGVQAQIGISNYKITPGDIVSWKYERSDY